MIKNAVQIPIIAVGRIEPENAEKYISEGKFNFSRNGKKTVSRSQSAK